MDDQLNLLCATLKEMLNDCKQVYVLLKNDGSFFSKNEFDSIENSNIQKMAFIGNLTNALNKLQTTYPTGFLKKIKESTSNSPVENEIRELSDQLHKEIVNCYKYIEVNSSIIYTNLKMLKDIWDKVIKLQSDTNVYDVSGNIVK